MSPGKPLIDMFRKMFPQMADDVKLWGLFNKNTIKIETKDRKTYIFTYRSDKDWGFQTYKNYVDSRD